MLSIDYIEKDKDCGDKVTDLERHRKRQISSLAKTVCPLLQYQRDKGSTQRKSIKIKLKFNAIYWLEATAWIKIQVVLFLVFLFRSYQKNINIKIRITLDSPLRSYQKIIKIKRRITLERGLEPLTLWLTATRSSQLSYSSFVII